MKLIESRNELVTFVVTEDGKNVSFYIACQDHEVFHIISELDGRIVDPETGWGFKTNRYPAVNASEKNIYLRGEDESQDGKIVTVRSKRITTAAQARELVQGIENLVNILDDHYEGIDETDEIYDFVPVNTRTQARVDESKAAVNAIRGLIDAAERGGYLIELHRLMTGLRASDDANGKKGKKVKKAGDGNFATTTTVRHSIYTRAQAKALCLTGSKGEMWPNSRNWTPALPVDTDNDHFNEHIGQAVQVLNQSVKG